MEVNLQILPACSEPNLDRKSNDSGAKEGRSTTRSEPNESRPKTPHSFLPGPDDPPRETLASKKSKKVTVASKSSKKTSTGSEPNKATSEPKMGMVRSLKNFLKKEKSESTMFPTISAERVIEVTQNPFENDPPWTVYEVSKMILVGLTLFPVRLVLFIVVALLAWCFASLGVMGYPLREDRGCYMHSAPLPRWRRCFLATLSPIYRVFLWCMGIWYIRIKDHRQDRSVLPKLIVPAPHTTMLDMFVMMYVFPASGFLGQHAVVKIPLVRQLGAAGQGLFIDLKNKESKHSCKAGIAARASPSWEGPPLSIFPEGTITNGKQLVQFKAGAFGPGECVLPVLITYPWRFYDTSWVGRNRNGLWFFRVALQFVNHCTVEILEVYKPSEVEKKNPIQYAKNVRAVMADVLGLPVTEHTYDDVFFYREAAFNAGVGSDFEVASLRKMFNADMDDLKDWLQTFKALDKTNCGSISRAELVDYLQLQDAKPQMIDRLFRFFDTDGDGSIKYREFLQLVALLSGKMDAKSLAKLAFLVYDEEGEGRVRRNSLAGAIDHGFQNPSSASREDEKEDQEEAGMSAMKSTKSIGQQLLLQGTNRASSDSDTVGFNEFCALLDQNPAILEDGIHDLRERVLASQNAGRLSEKAATDVAK